MASHKKISAEQEVYFCTVTCYKWLPLIQEASAYGSVYRWFNRLVEDEYKVLGYVIMPNHFHVLIFVPSPALSLNRHVAECKRFMAYDIVNRLEECGRTDRLAELRSGVTKMEYARGKRHNVFQPSFDARECFNREVLEQKLDYIHHNPVAKKWNLVDDFTEYEHSSASFYECGSPARVQLVHYLDVIG